MLCTHVHTCAFKYVRRALRLRTHVHMCLRVCARTYVGAHTAMCEASCPEALSSACPSLSTFMQTRAPPASAPVSILMVPKPHPADLSFQASTMNTQSAQIHRACVHSLIYSLGPHLAKGGRQRLSPEGPTLSSSSSGHHPHPGLSAPVDMTLFTQVSWLSRPWHFLSPGAVQLC